MKTEQKDKREEWWRYNKQGGLISWRDIDSGNLMEPPTGVAKATSPLEEMARARYVAETSAYDARINVVIDANRRTGETYSRMLERGAINGDEYWTIARWSRFDSDF